MIDHFRRSALNTFSASAIDRLALQRRDSNWFQNLLTGDRTRFVPVWRGMNLITCEENPAEVLLCYEEAAKWIESGNPILLGEFDDIVYVALELSASDQSVPEQFKERGVFLDLRLRTDRLPEQVAEILVFAKAMAYWHQRHRYCGQCGHATASLEAGYLRECTNEDCKIKHFPRTDPAVIVLVYDGDRCLLARQPSWPEGRYSVIAGFVEPGESLEDAVLREVAEETNVAVSKIHYHSSQPWPFPSSLMLGYLAEASSTEINLNDAELEHAHWLTRADIAARMKAKKLRLPPPVSISYRLIETWFNEGKEGELIQLINIWSLAD